MKIKKIKHKNYNLINNNLLNSRSYLGLHKLSLYYLNSKYIKGFKNKFCIFETLQTKNFVKKSLSVIYKYHYLNKKILFVGFPNIKDNKYNILFNKTNHYTIPHTNWVNNIIFNHNQIIRSLQKKLFSTNTLDIKLNNIKNLNEIFNIKQIPDLIVLYNQNKEIKAFREIIKSKIPLITFLNSSDKSDQINYKVPGGFQNYKTEKFCYLVLKSILTLPKSIKFYKKKYEKKKL